MAVFKRLSREEIEKDYTHYGWFMFCPIYIRFNNNNVDLVTTRNWIPEWVHDAAILWFRFCEMTMQAINPHHAGGIPIVFTGKIERAE